MTRNADNTDKLQVERGREILRKEIAALETAREGLGPSFAEAVRQIAACRGHVIVTGLGKAGLIGRKITATLNSTGTRAVDLHPVEALHGDLGMVQATDIVLALSNSGESEELLRLLPSMKEAGTQIILITANPQSRAAALADIVIDMGRFAEACPLGLAPSASTTTMLGLGDALALTVLTEKDFRREHYAQFHPAGALGRSLMRVEQIMRTGDACPTVPADATVREFSETMDRAGRAGAAVVVNEDGTMAGIVTNADFRRIVAKVEKPAALPIREVMTRSPKHATVGDYVADAVKTMRPAHISQLPVVDAQRHVVGLIDITDLWAAGFSVFDEK
ncbi:MAG: KpsF/GutQ family sugar-phosphate isomerase [Phycisphaerae bacterium]|nr:KpsF/GutQ family sugar-phosphate isomerase [Phycisphaerae bacterium]